MLQNCRTTDQKNAFDSITNIIEKYYPGGPGDSIAKHKAVQQPLISLIGIPGVGKSCVVLNIRKWVSLRIPTEKRPLTYDISDSDEASALVNEALSMDDCQSRGKAPAIAYSGAAAGASRGHTIHKALGFGDGDLPKTY